MNYLPKDFIGTAEGLLFAVLDAEMEEDRVVACLRYVTTGPRGGKLSTSEADAYLQSHCPGYLYRSTTRDVCLHGVPVEKITQHFSALRFAQDLIVSNDLGSGLEGKAIRLLRLFDQSGVPASAFGITGSLLVGMQRADSDLDLVLYDREVFTRARQSLGQMVADGLLEPIDEATWQATHRRRGCSLPLDEYVWHERRKSNKGLIDGTKFDLSLVTSAKQTDVERWRKVGLASEQMRVADDTFAFDSPARLLVDHPSVGEVLVFTATYVAQAVAGERIEVAGYVEESASGKRRMIVGTSREAANEYIRVLGR